MLLFQLEQVGRVKFVKHGGGVQRGGYKVRICRASFGQARCEVAKGDIVRRYHLSGGWHVYPVSFLAVNVTVSKQDPRDSSCHDFAFAVPGRYVDRAGCPKRPQVSNFWRPPIAAFKRRFAVASWGSVVVVDGSGEALEDLLSPSVPASPPDAALDLDEVEGLLGVETTKDQPADYLDDALDLINRDSSDDEGVAFTDPPGALEHAATDAERPALPSRSGGQSARRLWPVEPYQRTFLLMALPTCSAAMVIKRSGTVPVCAGDVVTLVRRSRAIKSAPFIKAP